MADITIKNVDLEELQQQHEAVMELLYRGRLATKYWVPLEGLDALLSAMRAEAKNADAYRSCPLTEKPCKKGKCAWWWNGDCTMNHAGGALFEMLNGGLPTR